MKEMMELALRGLQLLSEWTSIVTELYSVDYNYYFFLNISHILKYYQLMDIVETSAPY